MSAEIKTRQELTSRIFIHTRTIHPGLHQQEAVIQTHLLEADREYVDLMAWKRRKQPIAHTGVLKSRKKMSEDMSINCSQSQHVESASSQLFGEKTLLAPRLCLTLKATLRKFSPPLTFHVPTQILMDCFFVYSPSRSSIAFEVRWKRKK